jgi:hypothetical protein
LYAASVVEVVETKLLEELGMRGIVCAHYDATGELILTLLGEPIDPAQERED